MNTKTLYLLATTLLLMMASSSIVEAKKTFDFEENKVIVPASKAIDTLISSTKSLVVFFYTHTKESEKFVNAFLKVSSQCDEEGSDTQFAFVDMETEFTLRKKFHIQEPITIIYFKNGQHYADFILPKTSPNLKAFVEDPNTPIPPMYGPGTWSKIKSQVYHLTTRNISSFLNSHPKTIIMFYSPNCGHCEKMKPAYAEASIIAQDNKLGDFASFDCSVERSVCEKYQVQGFPTMIYFSKGKDTYNYDGDRSVTDLVAWFKAPSSPAPASKQSNKENKKDEL
ncbi:hypothetical protein SAMD00019534_038440 [Acytostelium subglobosum LB1]|uniref:hypothetical protein n=1 Tax=Acytostelium subglobosum LB1 TaxID=1410327 RepID=UPI000644C684|nr:hypothetical protein SAMD00019534_038440 [Acytostelium subglobosum LB1]GAM20669.1 hypothetical protein SAMD00019534_038440 [Acytostelium subglobosum LB1]|eukprot:XP_012760190.1 hypothetical protein SAMD00019534_038440 [Acytostelium subglobosum LB1]